MRKYLIALLLTLLPSWAYAQCNGQFNAGQVCGNPTSNQQIPIGTPIGNIFSLVFGTTPGILGYQSGAWGTLATPLAITYGGTGLSSLGTGVQTALGNNVNATGGFLTYSLIGTSGATLGLLDTNNTISGNTTVSGTAAFTNAAAPTISALASAATSCVEATTSGQLALLGAPCGTGSGSVTSVTANANGTLTISPTTGAVIAGINLSNANTWLVGQSIETGGTTQLTLNTSATAEAAQVLFQSNATSEWTLGNSTANAFTLTDNVASRADISVASNGNMTLMGTSGNIIVGSNTTSSLVGLNAASPGGTLDIEKSGGLGTLCLNITNSMACTYAVEAQYLCTGTTATDTAAINTFTANTSIHKLTIIGLCHVNALNTLPANFTLAGRNRVSDALLYEQATGNMVTAGNDDTFENLGFFGGALGSATHPTSGALLLLSSVTNITLHSLFFVNFWDAIDVDGVGSPAGTCPQGAIPCSGLHANQLVMYSANPSGAANSCVNIFGASGSSQPWNTDIDFDQLACFGASYGNITDGILINTCGDCAFRHAQVIFANTGVEIKSSGSISSGNQIQRITFSDSLIDSNKFVGFDMNADSSSQIVSVGISNSWLFSTGDAGGPTTGWNFSAETDGTATISTVQLSNDIFGNATGGVILDNNNVGGVGTVQISNSSIGVTGSDVQVGHGGSVMIGQTVLGGSGNGIYFTGSNGGNAGNAVSIVGNYFTAPTPIIEASSLPVSGMIGQNVGYHSGTPSFISCTGGSIVGNDYAGTITISGGSSNCSWTFANTFFTAPSCAVQYSNPTLITGWGYITQATNVQVGGLGSSATLMYICQPNPGN